MATGNEATRWLVGGVVGGIGLGIFHYVCPPHEDVRASQAFNGDVESMERIALYSSSAIVIVTALVMRSLEVFIVGEGVILACDFITKHANAINPDTGKVQGVQAATATSFPLPDYGAGYDESESAA